MSALAQQQQQQSPQVQQPSPQSGAQQGPVPEAASFGAGNAVEFQGSYGNGAVAGMAGVEGGGIDAGAAEQEGGSFEQEEPHLAAFISTTLQASGAAIEGSGDWSSRVPTSLQADADRVVFGLTDVHGYLSEMEEELRGLFAAEVRDEYAIANTIISAEELLDRVVVATELIGAYETLYLGSVADVAGVAVALAGCAYIGSELLEQRQKAMAAHGRAGEAQAEMLAAAQDIVELNLQVAAQAGVTIVEDVLSSACFAAGGPLAMPVVFMLGLVFGAVNDKLDENLGTEPADLTAGLDSVAGSISGQAGLIASTAEEVSGYEERGKYLGDELGAFDKALFLFETIEEGAAAAMAFREASQNYRVAHQELQVVCSEVETFYTEELPELVQAIEEIPELVEKAKAEAQRASSVIADLESNYGDSLYAPPNA